MVLDVKSVDRTGPLRLCHQSRSLDFSYWARSVAHAGHIQAEAIYDYAEASRHASLNAGLKRARRRAFR
jgi:hypothetical protein